MPVPKSPLTSPSASDGAHAQQFECVLHRDGHDAAWITVGGDLDLATAAQLEQALTEALSSARLIIVDLRQLTFIDSTGLHQIIDADTRARQNQRRLVLVRGPAHLDRLLNLTGLSDRLELIDAKPVDEPAAARNDRASPDAA